MIDRLAARLDSAAQELAQVRAELNRARPGTAWLDAMWPQAAPDADRAVPSPNPADLPGRLGRLANTAQSQLDTAWNTRRDAAHHSERDLVELAAAVRAAAAGYRAAEEPAGPVA
ncbi:hypothetical protein Cs7R123_78350 [Catellatospora sp. TT07R-123]|uniref:hypothetical protein n=1 Tax=Catellatospora sp. TT07R-123 TaxID=2733863 RepID=UPI001B13049C|nr:hypothetical protein [Catellatospora sp. TT07R-123]GHJ50493.1 hypothetical protein Cs7R123_78350 [Catellatospora sp. TT07R-123]